MLKKMDNKDVQDIKEQLKNLNERIEQLIFVQKHYYKFAHAPIDKNESENKNINQLLYHNGD